MIENSDSDPASPPKTKRRILTPTRKSKRTRTVQTIKFSDPPAPFVEAGRKKQKSSSESCSFLLGCYLSSLSSFLCLNTGPQASKKPTITSKDEPLGAAMYKKAEELRNLTLK
ncbi:hypothetical protein ACFX2F_041339 [Malus domestica]